MDEQTSEQPQENPVEAAVGAAVVGTVEHQSFGQILTAALIAPALLELRNFAAHLGFHVNVTEHPDSGHIESITFEPTAKP
jgi:hypothetical protein